MKIIYVAHPVRPIEGETLEGNLDRARRWFKFLQTTFPSCVFIAPWIVDCEVFGDFDPAQRTPALQRQLEVVRRCDGVYLVGGRVSSGMAAEQAVAAEFTDWSRYREPADLMEDASWRNIKEWAARAK